MCIGVHVLGFCAMGIGMCVHEYGVHASNDMMPIFMFMGPMKCRRVTPAFLGGRVAVASREGGVGVAWGSRS